jgi:hypothetical protein
MLNMSEGSLIYFLEGASYAFFEDSMLPCKRRHTDNCAF